MTEKEEKLKNWIVKDAYDFARLFKDMKSNEKDNPKFFKQSIREMLRYVRKFKRDVRKTLHSEGEFRNLAEKIGFDKKQAGRLHILMNTLLKDSNKIFKLMTQYKGFNDKALNNSQSKKIKQTIIDSYKHVRWDLEALIAELDIIKKGLK